MGNDAIEVLEYAKAEVRLWAGRLVGRCQAVADLPADRELARARKCAAVDELLYDVVLCLSGVVELLEQAAIAPTPAVREVLADLEAGDQPIREDFILDDEVLALREVCACGRDRGDHLVEAPHGSEDGACDGFSARTTMPALDDDDTIPPPAMPAGAW